jgi:hypothetical protein
MHLQSLLVFELDADGLSPLRVDQGLARREVMLLQLLLINHVVEIAELYDILFTLTKIGLREHCLISDDGTSIQPVGYHIAFDGEGAERLNQRIAMVRNEVHRANLLKLSRLIRVAFNAELRNAFSHSEYQLSEEGIYLTKYRRTISSDQLYQSFIACYLIQQTIYKFMEDERHRFIQSAGFQEQGWRIEPVVDEKGFAIRLVGSGPPQPRALK